MNPDLINRFIVILLISGSAWFFVGCDQQDAFTDRDNGFFPQSNLNSAKELALVPGRDSALIIWHKDRLVLEEYTGQLNRLKKHPLFSGTKSLAGIMAALAVRDGLFTFDTPIGDLIDGWDPHSERGSITIRELLNLTSGIQTAPAGQILGQSRNVWRNLSMEYEKGTTFVYGPTPFYIMTMIMIDHFGIDPVVYLQENLFQPLGLTEPDWQFSLGTHEEFPNLSFGAIYPAFDWIQLGILLLYGGSLDGISIIPTDIFSELLIPSDAGPNYGITFWLNTPIGNQNENQSRYISSHLPSDAFMKSGLFGQRLYIVPSMELIIARFGPILGSEYNDHEFFRRLLNDMNI